MTSPRIVLVASLSLMLAACAQEPTEPATADPQAGGEAGSATESLPDRDPELAKSLIEDGAIVIDTRSQAEFDRGHVEGAILIPHDEMERRLDEVVAANGGDKHKPVVLYCRSGHRAGIAKETLTEHGFDQVTNVGGIKALCESC